MLCRDRLCSVLLHRCGLRAAVGSAPPGVCLDLLGSACHWVLTGTQLCLSSAFSVDKREGKATSAALFPARLS